MRQRAEATREAMTSAVCSAARSAQIASGERPRGQLGGDPTG